jgi:hypothetical protein
MTLSGVKDCERSANLFPQLRKASLASYRCKNAFFPCFFKGRVTYTANWTRKIFFAKVTPIWVKSRKKSIVTIPGARKIFPDSEIAKN